MTPHTSSPAWAGLTAETPLQTKALAAWRNDEPLEFMWPSGTSTRTRLVAPEPDAIRAAEASGFVAPDPITHARRSALLAA